MRVLLVSSGSGSRGGGEIFLDYLGRGLSDRGHEVLCWIPNHSRMDELAKKCDRFAHVVRADYRNTYDYPLRSLSTSIDWGVSRRVASEWSALRPDVIHINKQNLEDGLDLLRGVRRSALPSVCTIHLTQTARYLRARAGWLRDWIALRHLRKYQGALVTVQEGRRIALNDFLAGRACTKTIFNGVPSVDAFASRRLREAKRRDLGLADSDCLILGLGRLVEQKRPLLFLRKAKELHERLSAAKFLWVGDGKLAEEWQREIAREKLGGIVRCIGWQDNILPYLLAGDLLLHVAEFEGMPFAVIEAMAAGLPCAITRGLALEIPFFNGDNVLFVDDLEALAANLRNPLVMAQIAEGGRRLIEDRLSVAKMAESYEEVYVHAIAAKRR